MVSEKGLRCTAWAFEKPQLARRVADNSTPVPMVFPKILPKIKKPSNLGGKELSIAAYYEGQNCDGSPDHYETREHAEELKSCGEAKPIHKGRAIMILSPRPERAGTRDSMKERWVVTDQTPKPCRKMHLEQKPNQIGPGNPAYSLL